MAEEQTRMSDPAGRRSPDEIRSEIERTRSELHETVDALERRLSPGDLFEELWNRVRGSGTGAGDVVRDHPVPLALMGLGLGWLAIEKATGGRASDGAREEGPSVPWHSDEPYTGTTREDDDGAQSGTMDRMKEKASSVKESAAHLGDRASDAKDRAMETASDAKDRARDTAHRAQDNLQRLSREQPLALGAITFGIGLAAGLAAPTTRWEDEHLGPVSDRVKDAARETAHDAGDVAKDIASEAKQIAGEAKDSIEESARETEGRSIGDRIGSAVDRAKETAVYAAGERGLDREGLRERGRDVAESAREHAREARDRPDDDTRR